ncbi:MAG: hypothetical protein SVX38_07385, partial [Chloroflexota bacterium]|nr:hypothetical protein [Chloroflexota bacterium]
MSENHNHPTLSWLLAVTFVVLWLVVAYASFYLVQKPFGPEFAAAVGDSILSTLLSLLIVLLGAALGRRLTRLVGISFDSPGEELALVTGVGLGVLSFVTLALGLVGLLYQWVF